MRRMKFIQKSQKSLRKLKHHPCQLLTRIQTVNYRCQYPTDVAEFQSRMIEHFRRKDTLQQSLIELLDIYESGPIYNRISEALAYSKTSRYRDFETTLDILFAGMDAETLKADLLRMEILRYRRLPYHNAEKNSAVLD